MKSPSQFWLAHSDRVAEEFGNDIRAHDWVSDRAFRKQQAYFLEFFAGREGLSILDVGCGNGLFTRPLSEKNRVFGLDFSLGMVRLARQNGSLATRALAETLPFRDESFDAVICVEMLQCVENSAEAVREMARVLRPGGTLIIQTLNRSSLARRVHGLLNSEYRLLRMYSDFELRQLEGTSRLSVDQLIYNFYPLPFKGTCRGLGWAARYVATSLIVVARV